MNTKLYLVGALCIAALLCMVPVSAFNQQVVVKSDISPSFSMSIAAGDVIFPLIVGTNEKLDGPSVTVTSNTPYTIVAKDQMINSKPAGTGGKMADINTGTGEWGAALTNALEMKVNGGSYATLSASDVTIRTGGAEAFTGPLGFRQQVAITDAVLPVNHKYQVELMVTGNANP